MINEIQIKNFKCFKQEQVFKFSKLNLLTGINGRGKSSLLQSILLIAQSIPQFENFTKLQLNGKYIELGNYEDIKNSETQRIEDILIKFNIDELINATFSFNENQNDELTALINFIKIEIEETEDVDGINTLISDFSNKLKEQFSVEGSSNEQLSININQLLFNKSISQIHYVSADRFGPVKYVDKTNFKNSDFITVGTRGEFSINILAKSDLKLVNEKLYLGNDAKSVLQQTEEWLGYILEGAKIKIEGLDKTSSVLWMLINNKSNSYKYKPTNVGFGYSYILPLIVSGLISQPDDIIIVENPEAHLHPRAQSRIAEFFSRVASCGVQVFIESHSEHILNGLRVSALNPDIELNYNDLTIHYFNESFQSDKLVMNSVGKIENWPEGFFDQQEIDLSSIFKFSKNNL